MGLSCGTTASRLRRRHEGIGIVVGLLAKEAATWMRPQSRIEAALGQQAAVVALLDAMRPLSSTTSRSIAAMVDSRCAMATTVLPSISRYRLAWMAASTSLSSALVASSSSRIEYVLQHDAGNGEMRWRWPPNNLTPRSPRCAL